MKRYFITGTDTGSGKTYVTCQLLDYFKARNKRVIGLKPVASGCWEQDLHLTNEDILLLQQHNGDWQQTISPWCFKAPISPHLAAEAEGQTISARAMADFCLSDTFADFDCQLVEGAGGLMVPLNHQETWIDFLQLSQIPVILVVGMRLGCLNHALLTASALTVHHIPCAGWIANCIDNDMLALAGNIKSLEEKMPWPLLATLPYEGRLSSNLNMDSFFT